MKIGDLVRFNHERDGAPVHRIVSVMSDGMVEINDMGGYFAPHLFVPADDIAEIPPSLPLPVFTKETLTEWADKIDSRLGTISGRDADKLAVLLRSTAAYIGRLQVDRADGDAAVRDAIRETAATADELAFWRYQAIWHRALMLQGKPGPGQTLSLETSRVWKEAERQLEQHRVEENRDRYAGTEAPRDIGS